MLSTGKDRSRVIAGIVIIMLGVLSLISSLGFAVLTEWVWIGALALAAVAFGWVYATGREGWALVGAYISGAVALTILLGTQSILGGNLLPSVILALVGLPFIVAWWLDRRQWGLLIPAYVMAAIIGLLLVVEPVAGPDDTLIPAYVMFVIGAPFVVAAVWQRTWALLIPGGIMTVIGLGFLGSAIGITADLLAIVVPVGLIVAGAVLLLRADTDSEKRKNV